MANLGYIQLTRQCNQKCLFCSNPENDQVLELPEAKKKIDLLKKQGYSGVILTGGEPTLSPILTEVISYVKEKKLESRIITNGQKIADFEYLKSLVEAGLLIFHVSFYSLKSQLQNQLSQNQNSYLNLIKALDNLKKIDLPVNLNIVINKFNADHLDKNVFFVLKNYPNIYHFVFNNLDPYMNRASENPQTVPKLSDFEKSLNRALKLLKKFNKSVRVERVPLCYLSGFEDCSTETRKIVKNEKRAVHFLDDKGQIEQIGKNFQHQKAPICQDCSLDNICAGLYAMDKYYDSQELKAQNIDPDIIINKIEKNICTHVISTGVNERSE